MVKRFVVDEYDGGPPQEADEVTVKYAKVVWVLASDYDALAAELAEHKAEHTTSDNANVLLHERIAALEAALRKAQSELGCLLDQEQLAQATITDDMWPEKPNEPDRECMSIAFNTIRGAFASETDVKHG